MVTTTSVGFFSALSLTCAVIRGARNHRKKGNEGQQNEQQMIALLAGSRTLNRNLAIAQKPTISEIVDEDDQFV